MLLVKPTTVPFRLAATALVLVSLLIVGFLGIVWLRIEQESMATERAYGEMVMAVQATNTTHAILRASMTEPCFCWTDTPSPTVWLTTTPRPTRTPRP